MFPMVVFTLQMSSFLQQIFHLDYTKNEIKATKVHEHDSERKAIMNSAVHPKEKSLAVGKDNECHLLSIDIKPKTTKGSKKKKNGEATSEVPNEYKVTTVCSEVTVKCAEEDDESDYQKVVRITQDGKHIVTGGSNGYICILEVNSCTHRFSTSKNVMLKHSSFITSYCMEVDVNYSLILFHFP